MYLGGIGMVEKFCWRKRWGIQRRGDKTTYSIILNKKWVKWDVWVIWRRLTLNVCMRDGSLVTYSRFWKGEWWRPVLPSKSRGSCDRRGTESSQKNWSNLADFIGLGIHGYCMGLKMENIRETLFAMCQARGRYALCCTS